MRGIHSCEACEVFIYACEAVFAPLLNCQKALHLNIALPAGPSMFGPLESFVLQRFACFVILELKPNNAVCLQHLSGPGVAMQAEKAGLAATPNPLHLISDGKMMQSRLGAERAGGWMECSPGAG